MPTIKGFKIINGKITDDSLKKLKEVGAIPLNLKEKKTTIKKNSKKITKKINKKTKKSRKTKKK